MNTMNALRQLATRRIAASAVAATAARADPARLAAASVPRVAAAASWAQIARRTFATEAKDSPIMPPAGAAAPAAEGEQPKLTPEEIAVNHEKALKLLDEGNEALANDKVQLALAKYIESVKLSPTSEALFNAGNVFLQMGRTEEAMAQYEDSLELGEHPDTLVNMANVTFMVRKDVDGAIALYQRALRANAMIHGPEFTPEAATMHGEINFNLACISDVAASQLPLPEKLDEAVEHWVRAERSFAEANKAGIERAEMLMRNVVAKRAGKVAEFAKKPEAEAATETKA
ncbi:hypothetical protein H9P43_006513 [Blastocladiella emersonii ATCC 22665]|nr:hypothetical protein H9P43_006513 [Blastocladiella emersonii ATCC 22665]